MSIYTQDKNLPYCTYITFYRGNKLPPFYIGYKDVHSILNNNYHGSVKSKRYMKVWLSEIKTNPHLFKTKILTYHDTAKEAYLKEIYLLRYFDVKNHELFINQSNGYNSYNSNKGRKPSSLARERMSLSQKKRYLCPLEKAKVSTKGKKLSQEAKNKISLSKIGKERHEETRLKISSSTKKNFKIRTPEDVILEICGLKQFCIDNDLSLSNMYKTGKSKDYVLLEGIQRHN